MPKLKEMTDQLLLVNFGIKGKLYGEWNLGLEVICLHSVSAVHFFGCFGVDQTMTILRNNFEV